jgi:hypothetical protein
VVESSPEVRRDQLVTRLTEIRRAYERCLSDVTPEVGFRGSEWSVADLLGHVIGGYYRTMARRLLEEDRPDFGGAGYDPEAAWRRVADRSLGSLDEALHLAVALTPDQMRRTGTLRGREYTPLDALDQWAGHFEEHLAQLRDEIRPREGLA